MVDPVQLCSAFALLRPALPHLAVHVPQKFGTLQSILDLPSVQVLLWYWELDTKYCFNGDEHTQTTSDSHTCQCMHVHLNKYFESSEN